MMDSQGNLVNTLELVVTLAAQDILSSSTGLSWFNHRQIPSAMLVACAHWQTAASLRNLISFEQT